MSDTHTREQLAFPVHEDAVMNRYVGQHFAPPAANDTYAPSHPVAYRRSWGKIVGGTAAVILSLSGGFLVGRVTAPDDTVATSAPDNSTSAPASTMSSADELVTQGLALHQASKLTEAAAIYEQALAKDAKNKFALFNLGQIAQTQGKYSDAIAKYKAVIEIDPKYSPALYNIGLAYAASGDRANAISSLRKALEVTPNNAPTLYNLGTLLVQDGKNDEGTKLITQAMAIDPTLKPAS